DGPHGGVGGRATVDPGVGAVGLERGTTHRFGGHDQYRFGNRGQRGGAHRCRHRDRGPRRTQGDRLRPLQSGYGTQCQRRRSRSRHRRVDRGSPQRPRPGHRLTRWRRNVRTRVPRPVSGHRNRRTTTGPGPRHRRRPARHRRPPGRHRRRHDHPLGVHTTHILIAEDEKRITSFLEKGLGAEGYTTTTVDDGDQAYCHAASGTYDLMILDLRLPARDGMSVLRALRADGSELPVVILTARNTVQDTVTGLQSGADDYLAKPFAFDELLARVRLRIRGGGTSPEPTSLDVGNETLNLK